MTSTCRDEVKGGTDGLCAQGVPTLEPSPVPTVRLALAATRVGLATVSARYSWNRVLTLPK